MVNCLNLSKLLICIIYAFLASCNSKNEFINFETILINQNNDINITETDLLLLGGVSEPYFFEDKILLPSHASNKIYLIGTNGELLRQINDKDSLGLRMPDQIINVDDNFYINDRGNHQIKVLNNDYKLLSKLPVRGQCDLIKEISVNGQKSKLLIHGVQRSTIKSKSVLFKLFDDNFSNPIEFAFIPKDTKYFTWRIAVDNDNNIYNVNVISNKIQVYNTLGKNIKTIKLKSSNIKRLLKQTEIKDMNPMEIAVYVRDKSYLTIRSINLLDDYILVQYINSNSNDSKFFLDVFDKNGSIVYSVIMKNILILEVKNNIIKTLVENNENEKSSLKIEEFKLAI